MTAAIVFALAIDKGAAPVAGAAPPAVLSRQLPRLAVHLLNGGADRGLRFFPLIGREKSGRRFLVVEELLSVQTLMALHGQQEAPALIVDGCILENGLRLRIHDGTDGQTRFDGQVPFDPARPLPAVSRLMFEIAGELHWAGPPPAVPALDPAATAQYLVARDHLLALEAGLSPPRPEDAAGAALGALAHAPCDPEVQQVTLDVVARLARAGAADSRVAEALERECAAVDRPGADRARVLGFLEATAAIFESCGLAEWALARYERIAGLAPARVEAACRAATLHFEAGRPEAARRHLRAVLDSGFSDAAVLAQLAVVERQLGNVRAYEAAIEDLLPRADLRPPMVRLVISYLIERDRADEALALADEFVRSEPEAPGPWFDKGRALLAAGRAGAAADAFEACLARAPEEPLRRDALRFLRFARTPDVIDELRGLEARLRAGELEPAARRARVLARRHPSVPEVWLLLGVAQHRLQRHARAERALRRALELEPDLGEAHNRLGILLVERGQVGEAHRHLTEAVRLLPDEPSAQLHLAQACRFLGHDAEGLRALQRAQSLGADRQTIEAVRRMFGEAG